MNRPHRLPMMFLIAGIVTFSGLAPWHADASHAADESPPVTQSVIAEGVGTTENAAFQDAIRNSVRQVVGVLVDAETLVKNDEVISDKVLTLSNGFVKKFDKLSVKNDGGLVRIRIRAEVERGQVMAKLKEFQVIATVVDGERIAIEKMTKDEIQKNTTKLLAKVLAEYPKTLKASAMGEPRETKGGKYAIKIRVEHDAKRLSAVGQDLTAILSKAHVRKDAAIFAGNSQRGLTKFVIQDGVAVIEGLALSSSFLIPAEEVTGKELVIWLASWVGEKRNAIRLDGYQIRANGKELAEAFSGSITIRVELLDANKKVLTETNYIPVYDSDDRSELGEKFYYGGSHWLGLRLGAAERTIDGKRWETPPSLFLAPGCMAFRTNDELTRCYCSLVAGLERNVTVDLTDAELQKLKEIRCTVEFKPVAVSK